MCVGSKVVNSSKLLDIMDVNVQIVVVEMEKYCVQWLVYGYIYCLVVYEFFVNDQFVFCVVLGVWYYEGLMVKVMLDNVELIVFFL